MIPIKKEEKKVEYLELIYDLIFVYIIGRNNSLLHNLSGGFVTMPAFLAYVMCTLAVIQIWNFSTFYINVYGKNSIRDHVFLFINMYLLYFMADGTNAHWQTSLYQYSTAWALILANLGIQQIIQLRHAKDNKTEAAQLKVKAAIILGESALVGVHMLVYHIWGISIAYVPILFGMAAMLLCGRADALAAVDFSHLTERAMLYVVFTFGEMIIAISGYFGGDVTPNLIYFSAMAFLIVAGLFVSYGVFYNSIIDRERETNGTVYMLVHIFLVFALNNLSAALEFMHDEEVSLMPKTLFLTGSFVLYYVCLFLLGRYAKKRCSFSAKFIGGLLAAAVVFSGLMIAFRGLMYVNIAVTVVFVYGIFILMYRNSKKQNASE